MHIRLAQPRISFLLICCFIGLLARLALVYYVVPYPERFIQADAIGYNQLALNLASGHGFSMQTVPPYTPDNFRTPGYPLTIAAIYRLFGYHPQLVLWLQIFMGVFTILLTYYLADLIGGPSVALIAAALIAISPHSITYTALLWSDTEYTLIFTLSMIISVLILSDTKLSWIIIGGVISAIAVLIHPRTIYFAVLFTVMFIVIMLLKRKPLKQTLINAGSFLLIFNLLLLPWRFRNYMVFGVPNVTSAAGINMLDYGAALTESSHTGENQWAIAQRYDEEVRMTSPKPLNDAEFADIAFRLGLKKILDDPLTYAKIHIIGMAKIFLPGTSQINTLITGENSLKTDQIYSLGTTNFQFQNGFVVQPTIERSLFSWIYIGFDVLYLCGIYFFSLYSVIKQGRSAPWLWLLVITLVYLAVVVGPAGAPRFRVVMMPLLSILAAYSVASIRYISRKMDSLASTSTA